MKSFILSSLAAGALLAVSVAHANTVVVGTADSGSGNEFPFGNTFGNSSALYEQIYNAADFSGPLTIDSLNFYNTQFHFGTEALNTADYSIFLATTNTAIGALTGNAATDDGGSDTLFGNYSLGGTFTTGSALTLAGANYNYDPANGNLLVIMEVTNSQNNGNLYLDALNGDGGTITSRWYTNAVPQGDSFGLVTGFGTASSAAPDIASTCSMLGLGLAALGLSVRRRRTA
ncbi:MAG TPA: hypothetical protein VGL42_10735 [Opitutaceae bacterium]|jgi:hypothetical protein